MFLTESSRASQLQTKNLPWDKNFEHASSEEGFCKDSSHEEGWSHANLKKVFQWRSKSFNEQIVGVVQVQKLSWILRRNCRGVVYSGCVISYTITQIAASTHTHLNPQTTMLFNTSSLILTDSLRQSNQHTRWSLTASTTSLDGFEVLCCLVVRSFENKCSNLNCLKCR